MQIEVHSSDCLDKEINDNMFFCLQNAELYVNNLVGDVKANPRDFLSVHK